MKTTYLVYKQIDGAQRLAPATRAEWDAIMKENRGLSMEQRRCFIKDCFYDEDDLDCMFIEVTTAEYRKWNRQNTALHQKRKAGAEYSFVSLDASNPGTELEPLRESIPSGFEVEKIATDHLLMEELKAALRKWKPWAEELLDIYLSGAKRSSTVALCEKYHLSPRAVQKRKADFEKFVLDFLGK